MDTLQDISFHGDEFYINHLSDNRPLLAHNHELRQQGNNGWSKCRTFQKIGSIPALEYVKLCKLNPELKEPAKLEKWLMSWEGAGYRIAEDNPHKCANIIIK